MIGASVDVETVEQKIARLEREIGALTAERDRLRDAYQKLQLDMEVLRRRIFVAQRERIDTTQLELEFGEKLAALDQLARQLDVAATTEDGQGAPPSKRRSKPRGRRDLDDADLPIERIFLDDPGVEASGEPFSYEESWRTVWRRGGMVRLALMRAKRREVKEERVFITTAELPPEMIARSTSTPSLLAHIATDKFCDGLPLHRQESRFAREGFRIDRGTMSRWLEDVGLTVGATVVAAMRDEAMTTAFCLATDATGVLVQPLRSADKQPRGCRRGHFFVQIADADHVFFEYLPRETSAAVGELFRGFSGYVQADAKSVYDLMFRAPGERPPPDDGEPDLAVRHEVGCWSHARRRFWEAAIAKDAVAREALVRIGRLFSNERAFRGKSPEERKALRDAHTRPHLEAFFAWAELEYEGLKDQRGTLRSALGYAVRQREALCRFLEDGRLRIDNNASERALRSIAVGRKAWLFVGSDDHAQAAGNLLTLIASARLHGLDPEAYLRDLFRVLPQWPRDRFLELAPRYWLATRHRLDPAELDAEVGWITVPPLAPASAKQQPAS